MFLADITNYPYDYLNTFDEVSVMLDELNELLEKGHVEVLQELYDKITAMNPGVIASIGNFSKNLSPAAKLALYHLIMDSKDGQQYCKQHRDACEELATKGAKLAISALKGVLSAPV